MDKAKMMEHYDELVTDSRLNRDELQAWVEGLDLDGMFAGRYRMMTTSSEMRTPQMTDAHLPVAGARSARKLLQTVRHPRN